MNLSERLNYFFVKKPCLHPSVFVASNATVCGDVVIEKNSSIWYQAVLRGDINSIIIGEETNLQDGVIVHLSDDYPTEIGNRVTVGHRAILHACKVEDEVLVGMGAILMDGAIIGTQSIIGAGALVPTGCHVPAGSLVLGCPAKVTRFLSMEERQGVKDWALKYVKVAHAHAAQQHGNLT